MEELLAERVSSQMGEGNKFMKKVRYVKSKPNEWKMVFQRFKGKKKNILIDIAIIDASEQKENLIPKLLAMRALRNRELKIFVV